MNIFETIGCCVSDTFQAIIEKNRIKAQINRLRLVMRSETKTIDKAYIELGKEYFKKLKNGEQDGSAEAQELCSSIVKATERFKRAIARYHELIDTQVISCEPDLAPEDEEEDENGDITLCCSYDEEKSETTDNAECTEQDVADDEAEPSKNDDSQSVKDKLEEAADNEDTAETE